MSNWCVWCGAADHNSSECIHAPENICHERGPNTNERCTRSQGMKVGVPLRRAVPVASPRLPKAPKPEAGLQRAVLDYLAATRILAFRMNTGAVKTESRFFRFGVPGMADILAFPVVKHSNFHDCQHWVPEPLWIECKAPDGRQSELQKSFQKQVEEAGHRYIIVRRLEDVEAVIGAQF